MAIKIPVQICPKCGFNAPGKMNFCPNCGNPLTPEAEAPEYQKESSFEYTGDVASKTNLAFQKMYMSLSPEEAGEQLYPRELFNFSFTLSIILKIVGVIGFIISLVIAMPMSGLDREFKGQQALVPLGIGLAILIFCFLLSFVVKIIGKLLKARKK